MSKSNKLEMIKREQLIQKLISESTSRNDVIRIVAKEFQTSERSVRDQYYQILKDLQEITMEERELLRQEIALQLEQIQRDARGKGASKVEMEAAMNRAKLLGLHEKVENQSERPKTLIFKEKDMSGTLEVVPSADKAENE